LGDIYVAVEDKHEVRRWKAQGGDEGTVVLVEMEEVIVLIK